MTQQQRTIMWIGGVAALACVIGGIFDVRAVLQAYLGAYLFAIGFPLGALGLILLHELTGGKWGDAVKPTLHVVTSTFPLLAVLFLPILLGAGQLYEWTHAEAVAHDKLLQHKQPYLNLPFFIVRALIYFAVWNGLAYLARRPQPQPRLGAIGLILYVLTVTFATIDWAMSLTPHWYSTIWGVIFMVSQGLCALSLAIVVLARSAQTETDTKTVHDLGNLLLAFVSLWAYMSFSQYLIIWSGNIAEEATWYAPRVSGGWGATAIVLIVLHFAVPFILLLNRPLKRDPRRLVWIAGGLLVIQAVHMLWLIVPSFDRGLSLMDPLAMVALLCACMLIGLRRQEATHA